MDSNVKNLLDRAKNTAGIVFEATGRAAQAAGKKAEALMENTKSNIEIFKLSGEIEAQLKEIGEIVYKTHKGEQISDDTLEQKLYAIDEKYAMIDKIRERGKPSKATVKCAACGCECGAQDRFCSSCGQPL